MKACLRIAKILLVVFGIILMFTFLMGASSEFTLLTVHNKPLRVMALAKVLGIGGLSFLCFYAAHQYEKVQNLKTEILLLRVFMSVTALMSYFWFRSSLEYQSAPITQAKCIKGGLVIIGICSVIYFASARRLSRSNLQ